MLKHDPSSRPSDTALLPGHAILYLALQAKDDGEREAVHDVQHDRHEQGLPHVQLERREHERHDQVPIKGARRNAATRAQHARRNAATRAQHVSQGPGVSDKVTKPARAHALSLSGEARRSGSLLLNVISSRVSYSLPLSPSPSHSQSSHHALSALLTILSTLSLSPCPSLHLQLQSLNPSLQSPSPSRSPPLSSLLLLSVPILVLLSPLPPSSSSPPPPLRTRR